MGRQLERAVAALAPQWADVKVTLLHGGDPVRVDVEPPGVRGAGRGVRGGDRAGPPCGCGPAGRFPIVPELGLAGAPVLLTGIGLPDDGLHSPNEKLDLAQLWSGIEIFGRFFELFAEKGGARGAGERGSELTLPPPQELIRLTGPEYRASVRACSSSTPMSARAEAMIPATTSSAQYGSGRSPAGSAAAQISRYRMAVVIHSVCADATIDQRAGGAELQLLQRLQVLLQPLGDRRGPEPVGHEAQHGAPLALLRLGQRGQVVPLVGDHLGEPDADRPDGGRQSARGLPWTSSPPPGGCP